MPHCPTDEPRAGSSRRVLRLSVPNELASVETARLQVLAFVEPYQLDPAALYRVELVLEEALMNRVMHAFPDGTVHETDVTLEVLADTAVLSFDDDGIAFDPTAVDVPTPALTGSDAPIGGRGLRLTRKAASAIEYRRVDGRNHVTVRLSRR